MLRVEIREQQTEGAQRTVATFRCEGEVVTCDNAVLWNHLVQATGGVIVGDRGRRFTPRDGVEFLQNLRFQYRGPYLFAHEVEDDDQPAAGDAGDSSPGVPAVVVEVPEAPRDQAAALDRNLFSLFVSWGAGEIAASREARDTVARLLEVLTERSTAEAFTDEELRIRLNQARYGVTPPPVVPRLATRVEREWNRLLAAIRNDKLARALVHTQLMGEYLRSLEANLDGWAAEDGLALPPERVCVGTRAGEVDAAWQELDWDSDDPSAEGVGFIELAVRRADRGLERAMKAAPHGDLHQAMIALRQAVTYNPASNEGRTLLGEVLLRMEHPLAMAELHKALFVEQLQGGPGRHAEARLQAMLRTIRLHRGLARAYLVQGHVDVGRHHVQAAGAAFDNLCEHGGTGWGGIVSEDEVRDLGQQIRSVLVNLDS
jgi:hypothetical protein